MDQTEKELRELRRKYDITSSQKVQVVPEFIISSIYSEEAERQKAKLEAKLKLQ